VDADDAAGPTAEGQARRTSFNELGWFGKKARRAGLGPDRLRPSLCKLAGALPQISAMSRVELPQRFQSAHCRSECQQERRKAEHS